MTVAVDVATEDVRTLTTSPQTFSHAGASSGVKGVLLAIVHGTSSTDHVSAASYGGVAMSRVQRNTDTATEPGAAEWWFLGAAVPQGTQTVSYTPGATTDAIHAVCITLLADGDTYVVDTDGVNNDVANPSVTMNHGGRTAMAFGALYGGGAAPTSFTPNANCEMVHDHDLGAFYSEIIRQTTPSKGDFAIGGTSSSDDVAFACVSVADRVETVVRSDSLTSGDGLVLGRQCNRGPFTDNISPNDALMFGRLRGRTANEGISTYDSNTQLTQGRRMGDIVASIIDAQHLSRGRGRVIQDLIDVTDGFSFTVTGGGGGPTIYEIVLSDGTVLVDQLIIERQRNRYLLDLLNVSDQQFLSRYRGREIMDTISGIADVAHLSRHRGPVMLDGVTITDAQHLSRLRGRVMLDNVAVTDQQLAYRLLFRLLTDTVSLFDGFITSIFGGTVFQITLSDVATVVDQVLLSRHRNRVFVDPLTLIDQALAYRLLYRLPTDTTTITDELIKSILGGSVVQITLSDAIQVADAFNLHRRLNRGLLDPVSIIDGLVLQRQRNRGPFTDAVVLSDGTVVTRERMRQLSDTLTITDAQLHFMLRMVRTGDDIGVVDNALVFRLRSRDLVDALRVIDPITAAIIGVIVPLTVEVRIRLGEIGPQVVLTHHQGILLGYGDNFIELGG